jgi:porphobilinogen synthase
MLKEVEEAWRFGVRTFVLFPKVPDNLKSNYADECYNPNGIVPRAVRYARYCSMTIYTAVLAAVCSVSFSYHIPPSNAVESNWLVAEYLRTSHSDTT